MEWVSTPDTWICIVCRNDVVNKDSWHDVHDSEGNRIGWICQKCHEDARRGAKKEYKACYPSDGEWIDPAVFASSWAKYHEEVGHEAQKLVQVAKTLQANLTHRREVADV